MAATVHNLQTRNRKGQNNGSNAITYTGFFLFPGPMLNHEDFIALSGKALKLLVDIGAQYNGRNNGDLQCARSVMRSRGWKSNDTLERAKKELIERSWIIESKKGGFNIGPSLYAITWQPIDECSGKLEIQSTTTAPRSLGV